MSSGTVALDTSLIDQCDRSSGGGPVRSKTVKPREPRGGPREKKVKSAPKSAAELDMELDSFMKDDSKPAAVSEDVEMAA